MLAISFLEAPLKFRAPDATLRIGLGIGRLVFRILNAIELVFAGVVVVALLIRHRLTRRSNAVLAGLEDDRSHAHVGYVVLESAKVALLLVGGTLLMTEVS